MRNWTNIQEVTLLSEFTTLKQKMLDEVENMMDTYFVKSIDNFKLKSELLLKTQITSLPGEINQCQTLRTIVNDAKEYLESNNAESVIKESNAQVLKLQCNLRVKLFNSFN